MKNEKTTNRWFVYDHYTVGGRPLMETALMTFAKLHYLYALISEDQIPYVLDKIRDEQDTLWEQNKRTKKVEVSCTDLSDRYVVGHAVIKIGQQSLRLRKVRDEID